MSRRSRDYGAVEDDDEMIVEVVLEKSRFESQLK